MYSQADFCYSIRVLTQIVGFVSDLYFPRERASEPTPSEKKEKGLCIVTYLCS